MVQENKGFINRLKQKYKNARVTYKEQIKEQTRFLTMRDLKLRILSFMLDAIFMFWPSIIFIISILLLTSPANIGGEMIRNTLELLIVYITSILLFNTGSSLIFRGQSIGMRYYGIKVVTRKKNELKTYQIIMRELIGISLPWACILLTYLIMGFNGVCLSFLAFIAINFIIILADPKHRSFIDIILNTTIVVLPDMDEQGNKETIEEIQEEVTLKEIQKEEVVEKDDTTPLEENNIQSNEEPKPDIIKEEDNSVTKEDSKEEVEPVVEPKDTKEDTKASQPKKPMEPKEDTTDRKTTNKQPQAKKTEVVKKNDVKKKGNAKKATTTKKSNKAKNIKRKTTIKKTTKNT